MVTAGKMRARAQEVRPTVRAPTLLLDHFEFHFGRLLRRAMTHADRVVVVRQPWFEKDYTPEETARFWHGGVGKPWKDTISVYYSLEVINELFARDDARVAKVANALAVPTFDVLAVLT